MRQCCLAPFSLLANGDQARKPYQCTLRRVVLPALRLGIPVALGEEAIDIGQRTVAADEEPKAFGVLFAGPSSVPRFTARVVWIEADAAQGLAAAMRTAFHVASRTVPCADGRPSLDNGRRSMAKPSDEGERGCTRFWETCDPQRRSGGVSGSGDAGPSHWYLGPQNCLQANVHLQRACRGVASPGPPILFPKSRGVRAPAFVFCESRLLVDG